MSLLRPRARQLCLRSTTRSFSAVPARSISLQIDRNDPEAVADAVPEYPYGPARWYKQSNKGLYGGQRIQFGNNVSGDFNTKTRRTFQVNVLRKRLWSHALNRFVQVRISARTLRTIDRVGGLDEYLLGDKEARIKQLGISGWWLRWAIMQQPTVKARFERERRSLGLAPRAEHEIQLDETEPGNVSAELEQAYAALPDEAEAEAMEAAEDQEAVEGSIPIEGAPESETAAAANDVFAIESPADLTPLKFRVDRRAHVVLTPRGWVRTRPKRTEYTRQWIADNQLGTYVQDRMSKFEVELAALRERRPDMSVLEEKEIRNAARRRFTKEKEEKVEAIRVESNARRRVVLKERSARQLRKRKAREEGELSGESDASDQAVQAA